jgi:hypothetical protein
MTFLHTANQPTVWRLMRFLALVAGLSGRMEFSLAAANPEPAGWYAGDMHAHRSCGGSPVSVAGIYSTMVASNLAVVLLLADMGNGEVQDPTTDLPLVNGQDASVSTTNRLVHWDAEWHWDATYDQYAHQALGGHVVLLGLTNAYQIWSEYTYPIFQFAHRQGGLAGFCHLQYLDDDFPQFLSCCTPIEYPVEVALGSCDFIAEDVTGGDSAIHAYYRLLNCGFRPGFAGGSDYPCGSNIGQTLTYVQIPSGPLTYRNWIQGLAAGRTVVSRSGHNEFLNLKVNGTAGPGDEIQLTNAGPVSVTAQWSAVAKLSGTIELVKNGVVVGSLAANVTASSPATFSANIAFTNSGWLCARRMNNGAHALQTAAVFVTVNHAPVRASVDDAQFYVQWMDNLLALTSPGSAWSSYFVTNRAQAQARYTAARTVYQQIAREAAALLPLTISSAALPYGTVNTPYTTTLTASNGATPYTWTMLNSSLPGGLTLNANSGVIAGTPLNSGTFNFTIQVTDAGVPAQTNSKTFNQTITDQSLATLWPASAIPVGVDAGADSPVELGVKFRSDVAGRVTAIRFYKAAANTGPHTGNLWSSNRTLLASVGFSGETASGWQQAAFATPVLIQSNTIYVASYHCNTGHYSEDDNYFANAGVDRVPLHAPADSVSGGNGVYAYGTTSAFPASSYLSANYWVDVAFLPTNSRPVPALVSLSVSPTNAALVAGNYLQFTAQGNYADGSSQNLTSQVRWLSSNSNNATIAATGLATGISPGQTIISAALNGITNSTMLTIQSAPLAITITALANGVLRSAYTATLTATGGVPPRTWLLISGALPPGLTLNSAAGSIGGIPASTGIFPFMVQVSDTGNPVQRVSAALSITVIALPASFSLWTTNAIPVQADAGSDSPVELGVKFRSDVAGFVTGIRFYKAAANTGTHVGNLWNAKKVQLATVVFTNETAAGWQQAMLALPVGISSNTVYVVSYHCNNGHYSEDDKYFAGAGVDSPPLHALADGMSGGNGVYAYGKSSVYPTKTYQSANYWVDVIFVTTTNIAPVLPAQSNQAMAEEASLVVTNTAQDVNLDNLSYRLQAAGTVLVTNAFISSNGVIRWTPTTSQSGSSNEFVTVVTDDGRPPLSATNAFAVVVNSNRVWLVPVIQSLAVSNAVAVLTWSAVSNRTYRLQYVDDLADTNWVNVQPDLPAVGPLITITNFTGAAPQRFYRVVLQPAP